MSSSGNNQSDNETSTFPMDAATFQTAVTTAVMAAVTVVLAHRSAISTSNADVGIEDSNRSINPGSQQTVTATGSQSRKTKNKKQKRQAQKERKKSQKLAIQQQQVETPAIPVPRRPYEENSRSVISVVFIIMGLAPKCNVEIA